MVPLSILDLSPVSANSTAAQALRNSLDLARHADGLDFRRYWVAEHHNLPDRGGDEKPARRIRRRDVAEPRALDGGRAVQGA